MRTFTRSQLDEARAAWDAGNFSDEWKHIRHRASMGGLIYPPEGTEFDSWADDNPSQRAILIRAIRETPRLLDKCVIRARSWSDVIARLLKERDDWRERNDRDARDEEWDRRDDLTHREAVQSLAGILQRIDDSRSGAA